MAAFHDYSSAQNGNHEVTVIPDGQVTFASIANQASRPAAPPPVPLRDEAEKNSISVDQTTARHNPERVTLNDLIGRFKDGWGHLAASTRSKFECHFKVAGEYVDFNRDVSSLQVADLRALKSKLSVGRKPSTVNDIIFKALGALFKLALEDEIIKRSPLERFKPARKGEIERIQPRGVFVTRTGFQSGAIEFARAHGILLYELRGPTEADFKGRIAHMTISATILAPEISNVQLVSDDAWLSTEFALRGLSLQGSLPFSTKGMTGAMRLVDDKGVDLGNVNGVIVSMFKSNKITNTAISCSHSFDSPTFLKTEAPEFPLL